MNVRPTLVPSDEPDFIGAPGAGTRGSYATRPGRSHPLGATPDAEGVNFALFSENATSVELLLFERHDDPEPAQVIALDPRCSNTFFFWHTYVEGLKPGAHYAYRVDGPDSPQEGHRFDVEKVLVDPYSCGNTDSLWDRGAACRPGDNVRTSMRSVVVDNSGYNWEGDRPLRRPMEELVIYEMHVGGFTRSPSSGVRHPGTFLGVIEKIPYLKALGVTAVELLPIFDFDENEVLGQAPDGTQLRNYWGYSTIGFFAPDSKYCVSSHLGRHLDEFRDMVKALHRAGIEVILDVVFNHTNEGNHLGPTISFKGIDNKNYYFLVPGQQQYFMDYSGCGNTLNVSHPLVGKLILDCLRFWVSEMHVDGFRFDEGSVLTRDASGAPAQFPPVTWGIELDEALLDTKIIAEAWDAAGLYQVGYFPGYRWAEWNGRYRDDVRRFVRGDAGMLGAVASRVAGSADLYQARNHFPINSVNFVTAHDGFTLNDLVSYDGKHNAANGEGNRDGNDDNLSWNCGVEGATDDKGVRALRTRQVKNFATILMTSQGVPMFVAGDEVGRTQGGNNNAYCQDGPLSWFDWNQVDSNAGLLRFWQGLIDLRRRHPELHRSRFFTGQVNARGLKDICWHGTQLAPPDWSDPQGRAMACTLGGFENRPDLHIMMNMYWDGLTFDLPGIDGWRWHRVIDTAAASPDDIADPGSEVSLGEATSFPLGPRSIVLLVSKPA
jgi:isoamylase